MQARLFTRLLKLPKNNFPKNEKEESIRLLFLFMHMKIFLLCCFPAADVTLLPVEVQNLLDLRIKGGIYALQSFGYILMYRGFAYSVCLGTGSDGCLVLYDILAQNYRAVTILVKHILNS